MLALWSYARYAEKPGWVRYMLVLVCLALGLMAKQMLVTLPCVLLLLDYWPLRRLQFLAASHQSINPSIHQPISPPLHHSTTPILRLFLEKVPLLALSAISAWITIVAHQQLKSLAAADQLPMSARLANAVVSYARYLGKMAWPADLSVLYPHPGRWPAWAVAGASVLLAGITGLSLAATRRRPYLLAGWVWFLVTLLPVIGITSNRTLNSSPSQVC